MQARTVRAMKLVLLPFATFGIFHLCCWGGFGILNDSPEVPAGCCESARVSPGGNTLRSGICIIWGV